MVSRSMSRCSFMAGSPIVVAPRSTPLANTSVLSERDEVMKVRHLPGHLVQGTRDPGRRRRADVVRTSSGSSGRPAARERVGEGVRPPIAQLRAGSREVGPPPYFIRD